MRSNGEESEKTHTHTLTKRKTGWWVAFISVFPLKMLALARTFSSVRMPRLTKVETNTTRSEIFLSGRKKSNGLRFFKYVEFVLKWRSLILAVSAGNWSSRKTTSNWSLNPLWWQMWLWCMVGLLLMHLSLVRNPFQLFSHLTCTHNINKIRINFWKIVDRKVCSKLVLGISLFDANKSWTLWLLLFFFISLAS